MATLTVGTRQPVEQTGVQGFTRSMIDLGSALRDAELVEHLAQDASRFPEAICFHSQQLAEELAKNALVANGIIPSRSHAVYDLLARLIDDCRFEVSPDDIAAASFLSSYATKFRYIVMTESEKPEAVQAIYSVNRLAAAFERNGYPAVHIDYPASMLYDEAAE